MSRLSLWVARQVEQMREDKARGCSCAWDARAFRTPTDGCPIHDWKLDPRFRAARAIERQAVEEGPLS